MSYTSSAAAKLFRHLPRLESLEDRNPPSDMRSVAWALPQTPPLSQIGTDPGSAEMRALSAADDDVDSALGLSDPEAIALVPAPQTDAATQVAPVAETTVTVQQTESAMDNDPSMAADQVFTDRTFTPRNFETVLSDDLDQLGDLMEARGPTGSGGGAEGSLAASGPEYSASSNSDTHIGVSDLMPNAGAPAIVSGSASDQALSMAALAMVGAGMQPTPVANGSGVAPPVTGPSSSAALDKGAVMQALDQQGLRFEQNVGQIDRSYDFVAHSSNYSVALSGTEIVTALTSATPGAANASEPAATLPSQVTFGMQLVGANRNATAVGERALPGITNYLSGDPALNHTGIVSYSAAAYQNVYDGVDVVYHSSPGTSQFEYDFVVAPGADAGQVKLAFQGTNGVSIDSQGQLVLHTDLGDMIQHAPLAYQDIGGVRSKVSSHFVIDALGDVQFALGAYDHGRGLTIDPTFAYSSYLGGTDFTDAWGVTTTTVAGVARVFVVGTTSSPTFRPADAGRNPVVPTLLPANGPTIGAAFVIALNPAANDPVYLTYLTGTAGMQAGTSIATAVKADTNGNAYIAGTTTATNFPVSVAQAGPPQTFAAWQRNSGGAWDAFAACLNPTGQTLIWGTYLGGGGDDSAYAISIDNNGTTYVGGVTGSATFNNHAPDFGTGLQRGGKDGFVARLTNQGALDSLVTINGTGDDIVNGLAYGGGGAVYVVGYTLSPDLLTNVNPQFPPFQPTKKGPPTVSNGFVAKLVYGAGNAVPTVSYATYFGSILDTSASSVAVNAATGDAFVVGYTSSPPVWGTDQNPILWTVLGAAGGTDAWVAKFDATGNPLGAQPYHVYIAGKQDDSASGVALVPQAGNNPPYLYVSGTTKSNDAANGDQFPATGGPNKLNGGFNQGAPGNTNSDGFIALLNPSATDQQGHLDPTQSIQFLGYIGGTGTDQARAVALDPAGTNAWVAGLTNSADFRFGNVNGMQLTAGWAGGRASINGFVVSVAP